MKTVSCKKHGVRRATLACHHLAKTARDFLPRGVHWYTNNDDTVSAFCDCCWSLPMEIMQFSTPSQMEWICRDCLSDIAAANGVHLTTLA